ncbi:MAG: hypothetical protein ACTSXW_00035 [Candidatus Baldrarchaeia archaeon]
MEAHVHKLLEEAEEYLGKRNYSKAAYKYFEVAKTFEKEGKTKEAERYFKQAVDNFVIAANEARRVKSFRKAAENSLMALEVYEKLKMMDKRDPLILNIASDLANAANEYLMWGEIRGAATCVTISSLIYFAANKVDDARNVIEGFKEKISAEDFEANRILNIASLIQKVIVDSDVSVYSEVERLVNSVLKPMLPLIKGSIFVKVIDESIQIIGSKIKKEVQFPRIVPAFHIPFDLTFGTSFDITLKIKNIGDGEAKNLKITFNIPEEMKIVRGKQETTIDVLPANKETDIRLTLNVPGKDVEKEEYSIDASLEYFDMLGTAYSTTIGPIKITLHRVRESEKLRKELKNKVEKIPHLKEKAKGLPEVLKYVFLRLINDTEDLTSKVEKLLREEKVDEAKSSLKVVDFVLNEISQILEDKKLVEKIELLREQLKKEETTIRTSEGSSKEAGG